LTWPSGAGRSSLRNRRDGRRPRRGRSGSLVLPRSLPGHCASPRWPSRSSDGAAPCPRHLAMTRIRADPRGLGSPSEHSSAALVGLSSTSSRGIRRCWPPRPRLSPQPETRTPHPSTDPPPKRWCLPAERPLPQTFPPASAPEMPSLESCSVLVVSHHLDGFLRSEVAGLLHPAAGHGVRCVSGQSRPQARRPASRSAVGGEPGVLAAHFIPLEESSVAAAPRHRGRCPLAVGCRTGQTLRHPPLPMNISEPHLYGASTSGRSSAAESGHETDRCRSEPHPVLPWALFPFEVLPSCRRASRAVDRGARVTASELRSVPSRSERGGRLPEGSR
jgi:hypothetical protein